RQGAGHAAGGRQAHPAQGAGEVIAGAPAAESEMEQLLARIPMPAFVIRGGRVVASNDRFCAMLGRSRAELLAAPDPFHAFVAPDDAAKVFARHDARPQGPDEPEE